MQSLEFAGSNCKLVLLYQAVMFSVLFSFLFMENCLSNGSGSSGNNLAE